jgi:hypothetical protein
MTQLVQERERWSEFVGTHVNSETREELFRVALERQTSVSAVLRRALVRELKRARNEKKDEQ